MAMVEMARRAHVQDWVASRGGVAHTRDLRSAGFLPHDVARAVSAGLLTRVRRSWVATPHCDPRRTAAAAVAGRVTCVTAAEMAGLWIPPGQSSLDRPHIAVRPTSSRHGDTGAQLHWAVGPVPCSPTVVEDPLLNVLFHVARCLPRQDALTIWESAIRKQRADPAVLARTAWHSTRAQALASMASALSDSGLETVFVDGMRRCGIVVRQQVRVDGHLVDGLIGERLIVQIDGFTHHQAADRRRDLREDARLLLRGYLVLRFDFQQILFDWPHVEETVVLAIAQGLHRR